MICGVPAWSQYGQSDKVRTSVNASGNEDCPFILDKIKENQLAFGQESWTLDLHCAVTMGWTVW